MDNIERIMIVDDDVEDREFFSLAVKMLHPSIEIIEAVNGEDGLNLLAQNQPLPWCIFLDLNMPRVNGLQFLKSIKKIDSLKNIPVIMCTTSKLEEDKEKALRSGAVHFLIKPCNLEVMQQEILMVLERIGASTLS